jgi:hypothetical protein
MSTTKKALLTKARKKWMARTFEGLFLLMAAGTVGDAFLKFTQVWRLVVIGLGFGAFVAGFLFAKTDASGEEET